MIKLLRWLAMAVLLLVFLLAMAFLVYRGSVLPQTEGTLEVKGLNGEVSIVRDGEGIPTIRGRTLEDALFGLGFVHAQDRLWQLETHRRIGSGRLAEAFGPAAVDNDKFLRALGVRRAAAVQWKNEGPVVRSAVEAYTAGINAFISDHLRARPPEFLILGIHPEPWTPVDTYAWAIMMAWDLGGNWSNELLRMRLARTLPVDRINQILPPYPGEKPLPVRDYAALYRELGISPDLGKQALLTAPESGIDGIGSNNWVLSGSRTVSGKPLLANDPHLKLTTPALWYFARLEAPGLNVAGASMPGLPMVVLGQNQRIAWGFTNTNPDVQDLFLFEAKADDPGQYRTYEGWKKFEEFKETIRVRGGEDVSFVARTTWYGPVISDADSVATRGLTAPRHVLALRWTALDGTTGTMDAGLLMNRAGSVQEFMVAAERYSAPMQNMVVADVDGNIGFIAPGSIPLRRADNDLKGQVPAPGADRRYYWQDYLDRTRTPREINPARGWIATANQRTTSADYPHYITSEWAMPYRQQRIETLINEKSKHDRESLAAIHADVVSLSMRKLLPHIKAATPSHRLGGDAKRVLADFDGTMRADSAAALIAAAWAREMARAVFADELGGDETYLNQVGGRDFRPALEGVLERNDGWWCDDKTTPAVESCADLANRSMDRALAELEQRFGGDPALWRWGNAHAARSEHRPFSKVKALARWFEIRVPTGGDNYTVNAARYHLKGDEPDLPEHAASLRAIYDLGDPSRSVFMHSSGQSGIPLSAHHRNFAERWSAVQGVPVWATGQQTLTLRGKSP